MSVPGNYIESVVKRPIAANLLSRKVSNGMRQVETFWSPIPCTRRSLDAYTSWHKLCTSRDRFALWRTTSKVSVWGVKD